MYLPKDKWSITAFKKSPRKNKKYVAILQNANGDKKRIHFGSRSHEHYFDKLELYSHLNHYDKERRENYRKRHKGFIRPGYHSAGSLSWEFLW